MKIDQLVSLAGLLLILVASTCQPEPEGISSQLIYDSYQLADSIQLNSEYPNIFPRGEHFAEVPSDPDNPITIEKVKFGSKLFFDTRLSISSKTVIGKGTSSCASCHTWETGFSTMHHPSFGEGGVGPPNNRVRDTSVPDSLADENKTNAHTSMLISYNPTGVLTWNGRLGIGGANEGIPDSILCEITDRNCLWGEGGLVHAQFALLGHRNGIALIAEDPEMQYYAMDAFPNLSGEHSISIETVAMGLDAFQRVLTPSLSPYQDFLRGDTKALSVSALRGFLKANEAGCFSCHGDAAFGNTKFANVGFPDFGGGFEDPGRFVVTRDSADWRRWKVPTLYNAEIRMFHGHGGVSTSTKESILAHNGPDYTTPALTVEELNDIDAWINSLTDDKMDRYTNW